jgi:hypothetical protein
LNTQPLGLLFSNRDFSPSDYDALLEIKNGMRQKKISLNHGASDEEINRCPTRILVSDDELIGDDNDESNSSFVERTKCIICLENYKENDYIRTLPCVYTDFTLPNL